MLCDRWLVFSLAGAASAQSLLRRGASVVEVRDGSQQQQQQQPKVSTAGGYDNGSGEVSRAGGGGRALARAKSFVQQRLPRPNQVLVQGQKEDEGGGEDDEAEEARGGEEEKIQTGRAPQEPILLSKAGSVSEQLPRPEKISSQGERRATNLGPMARAPSLAEQLPRPQQVLQAAREEEEDEGAEEDEGSDRTAGKRQARAGSSVAELLGRARALRGEGSGDDGGGGEGGASTNRGGMTKAPSFGERLPRPEKVLQGKT